MAAGKGYIPSALLGGQLAQRSPKSARFPCSIYAPPTADCANLELAPTGLSLDFCGHIVELADANGP
jgi:hypothetical protein